MHKLRMRINVGSALRPEEFSSQEFFEAKVEALISLGLQTAFDFAETEITDVDYEEECTKLSSEAPPTESELPDDLL